MNGMNKKGIWHAKAVEMSQDCLNALLRTETAIAQKLAQFAEGDEKSPCEQGLSIDPVDLTVVLQALGVIEEIHNLRYADRQARGLPAKAGDDMAILYHAGKLRREDGPYPEGHRRAAENYRREMVRLFGAILGEPRPGERLGTAEEILLGRGEGGERF